MSNAEWVALATIAMAILGSLHARALWSLHGRLSRIDQTVSMLTEEAKREETRRCKIWKRIENHERRIIVHEQGV
jgi:hypothetical protein